MVLIGILAVIGFITVLVLNLSADSTYAAQLLVRTRTQDSAYYVGQSAVLGAVRLLPGNAGDAPHTLLDSWAIGTPPLVIDNFIVRLRMVDEERYFNPNKMVDSSGNDDPDRIKVFRRMLRLLNQNEDFCNALLDWIDTDSQRRSPGGAEGTDYPDRACKNEPLDSVDEISWIRGATSQLMNGVEGYNKQLPGLRDLLTVYSSGTVNINTAPMLVLQSLAVTMNDSVAQAVMERRAKQPFNRMEDLLKVTGLTQEHLYYLRKFGDVRSGTWRIEAFVTSMDTANPISLRVAGVFSGNATNFRVQAWYADQVSDQFAEGGGYTINTGIGAEPSPQPSASRF